MLINSKGVRLNPEKLPNNRPALEAVLKDARELLLPLPPKCGQMFKLGTRARLSTA